MSLLHRLRNWFTGIGGNGVALYSAICLATLGLCIAIASCSALREPVTGPDGQPMSNPDGSARVVYDVIAETGTGIAGIIGGNPLWATIAGAALMLGREKIVGKKAPPAPVPPPSPTP